MENKSYWLKGGLFTILLSIFIVPLSLFITIFLFGADQYVAWFIAPEFYLTLFDLGMRGTPAMLNEVVYKWTIAIIIFAARFFIMGAVLGLIYGQFAKRNRKKLFFIGLIIIYFVALGLLSYRYQNLLNIDNSVNSPTDCSSAKNKGVKNFNENECYKTLAVRNQDINICDNIINPPSAEVVDYKAFCYEEVAHVKKDPSICGLIPEKTFNDHNTETLRRDGCYDWFKLCENIMNTSKRDYCYMDKAEFQNDVLACDLVVSQKDRCYLQAGVRNKNILVCDKIIDQGKKQQCVEGVYYNRARDEQNSSLCDQIKNQPSLRASCYENIK